MDEKKEFAIAAVGSRFAAFLIDAFFIYILRFLYINFLMYVRVRSIAVEFASKYRLLFGELNLGKMTSVELNYLLRSSFFKEVLCYVVGSFMLSAIYDIVFMSVKWSATPGQRIMGIYVSSSNGDRLKWYQIVARGVLTNASWCLMFFVITVKYLSAYGVETVDRQTFVIAICLFLTWYDMTIVTKNRVTFHDFITKTIVVRRDGKSAGGSLIRWLFPDFKGLYAGLKDDIKQRIRRAKEFKEQYKKQTQEKQK